MPDEDSLSALRKENDRLIALLEANRIDWRFPPNPPDPPDSTPNSSLDEVTSTLGSREKIALFRRLFQGRTDVYPIRWESKTSGKSGYSPACANEWRAGVCEKPRIKCSDCGHRLLIPLSDAAIHEHLTGKRTLGVYPLLADDN